MRSVRRFIQSPSFWPLQIGGWLFYWLMVVVTFLPTFGPERAVEPLVELKAARTPRGLHDHLRIAAVVAEVCDTGVGAADGGRGDDDGGGWAVWCGCW